MQHSTDNNERRISVPEDNLEGAQKNTRQDDTSGEATFRVLGLRLPQEVIDKALEDLADDPSRKRKEIQKDFSACSKACWALRISARRARYKERTLDLIGTQGKIKLRVKEWNKYLGKVIPHLRRLTVDWRDNKVMAREDVTALLRSLEKASLHELNIKGPIKALTKIMYPLAQKESLTSLSFQYVSRIPEEFVLRRSNLQILRLLNAQTDLKLRIPFAEDMSFEFDMRSPIDPHLGLRSPKVLSLVLYECSLHQYILFETYCKTVVELSL